MSEIKTNPRDAAKTVKAATASFVIYFVSLWLLQLAIDHNHVPLRVVIIGAAALTLSRTLIDTFLPKQIEQMLEPSPPAKRFDRNDLRHGIGTAIAVTVGFSLNHFRSGRAPKSITDWIASTVIYLIGGFIGGYGFLKLTRAFTGRITPGAPNQPGVSSN